jgi:prepilin-type N-terminal cleavage/methylation domain-containing protein
MYKIRKNNNSKGFTVIEVVIVTVVLPIIIIAISQLFNLVRLQYAFAKQYNEAYAVLSACPELDRALQYELLSGSTNCFPNNIFNAEGGYSNTFTYNPTLSVTDTSSLNVSDPLQTVPDSKVVDLSVGVNQSGLNVPLKMRLLITRSGIGQQ